MLPFNERKQVCTLKAEVAVAGGTRDAVGACSFRSCVQTGIRCKSFDTYLAPKTKTKQCLQVCPLHNESKQAVPDALRATLPPQFIVTKYRVMLSIVLSFQASCLQKPLVVNDKYGNDLLAGGATPYLAFGCE
eukprot:4650783-Pyramimonas_sp.AAC.1